MLTGTPCPLINSPEDRKDLVRRLFGIREVLMVPFDHEMMTTPWDDFVTNILVGRYHASTWWRATTTTSATRTRAPRSC